MRSTATPKTMGFFDGEVDNETREDQLQRLPGLQTEGSRLVGYTLRLRWPQIRKNHLKATKRAAGFLPRSKTRIREQLRRRHEIGLGA